MIALLVACSIAFNFLCDSILNKLNKDAQFSQWTLVPPLGVIMLILYPFKSKDKRGILAHKDWAISHLAMTDSEYKFMVKYADNDEIELLLTPPKTMKEKREILKIIDKYKHMYIQDHFKRINNLNL